jgi:molybdenum cofactor biosynthesis enzyme MoaA
MRLEDIGFYTLCDARARQTSAMSPMWRCEMILTDRCNFKCPYCRGLRKDLVGDISLDVALSVLDNWIADGLRNVRFTGGEPTLYSELDTLIERCREVEHIAISTNGSRRWEVYERLLDLGVNDFSISLDGGCCSVGDTMSGGIQGSWKRVVDNICRLSKRTYVTVGMVFNEDNIDDCLEHVRFVDSLDVSDIRVIPSAQYNKALEALSELDAKILAKYPVLRYRIENLRDGNAVRGLKESDAHNCWLVQDDSAVAQGYHFPCIIYLREGGDPIGPVGPDMREARMRWAQAHDPHDDPICRGMCLDVCVDYNNKVAGFKALKDQG